MISNAQSHRSVCLRRPRRAKGVNWTDVSDTDNFYRLSTVDTSTGSIFDVRAVDNEDEPWLSEKAPFVGSLL